MPEFSGIQWRLTCIIILPPASAGDCLHLPKTACIFRRLSASAGDCLHLPETTCICRRLSASAGDCLHLPETACICRRLLALTNTHRRLLACTRAICHLSFVICHLPKYARVCRRHWRLTGLIICRSVTGGVQGGGIFLRAPSLLPFRGAPTILTKNKLPHFSIFQRPLDIQGVSQKAYSNDFVNIRNSYFIIYERGRKIERPRP